MKADPETLTAVQKIIAKQLAVTEDKVHPESKFSELGADSLDTVRNPDDPGEFAWDFVSLLAVLL